MCSLRERLVSLSGLIAASYEEARLVNSKEVALAEIEVVARR
jgi:hypothetical protein